METKVYTLYGRPRIAVRVATCTKGVYINFATPKPVSVK